MGFMGTRSISPYVFVEVIPMLDTIRIDKTVRAIRKSCPFQTQEQFAERIDTSPETVSNIERGTGILSTAILFRIAQ